VAENRPHLQRLADRLVASCAATGYHVHQVAKEG
jgi:hypothetical protein